MFLYILSGSYKCFKSVFESLGKATSEGESEASS